VLRNLAMSKKETTNSMREINATGVTLSEQKSSCSMTASSRRITTVMQQEEALPFFFFAKKDREGHEAGKGSQKAFLPYEVARFLPLSFSFLLIRALSILSFVFFYPKAAPGKFPLSKYKILPKVSSVQKT
jgi:hypothetical protein